MAFRFPKSARLLRRPEFLAVKEGGRSFADGPLAASWKPREGTGARVGLIVSSTVGNAVVRNRIKRRLREAVRHELATMPDVDLVLVARRSSPAATVPEIRSWLQRASARIRKGSA